MTINNGVQINHQPNGNTDIRVGTGYWSHTVYAPDGRVVYDRGIGPNGSATVFQSDSPKHNSPFTYGSPFVPSNPPFPQVINPFGK
jgi:hypothetical protein